MRSKHKKPRFNGQTPPMQPVPQMQVMANGGVNDAVNFATEDFYKAAAVLKYCSKEFTVPYNQLPPGVASFAGQQIFRLNAAGQMLDALGYQGVTEVLAAIFKPAVDYTQATMAIWNKVIAEEGEVQKIWDKIAEEEKGKVAEMH